MTGAWWRRLRERQAANRELGKASEGGEQGAFEPGRKDALAPYKGKNGKGGWTVGKTHESYVKKGAKREWLTTEEERHIAMIGNTRAWKTVSQLAYHIARSPTNKVVFDPKCEFYLMFAKVLAAKGWKVHLWDPFLKAATELGVPRAPFTTDYNPFLDMANTELGAFDPGLPNRITELVNLMVSLGKEGKDSGMQFWNIKTKEVVSALWAFGLIYRDKEAEAAYDEAEAALEAGDEDALTNQHLWDLIAKRNILFASEFPNLDLEDQISLLEEMANIKETLKAEAEEAGMELFYPSVVDMIVKGAKTGLRLAKDDGAIGGTVFNSLLDMISASFEWIDSPVLKHHLRGYDQNFHPSMLKTEEKVILFAVIPEENMESHGAYMRMAFTSIVDSVMKTPWGTKTLDDGRKVPIKRYKIDLICEEIAQWGHMKALKRALGMGAGKGLRVVVVLQNMSSLIDVYGKALWEFLIANSYQILIGGGDNETGEYFSIKSGKTRARNLKTKKRSGEMVPVYTIDMLWNTVHESRNTGLLCENGKEFIEFEKIRYYDEAESGLKKYIDYTPHPDHVTDDDTAPKRHVPRELLAHSKGEINGGPRHMQFGGGGQKQIETHH